MIYLDRITHCEYLIAFEIKTIDRYQTRFNTYLAFDTPKFIQKRRSIERMQYIHKNKIDKYREEIRQLKSLQRDAA